MLIDEELFKFHEQIIRRRSILDGFDVKKRIMVTSAKIPEDTNVKVILGKVPQAYEISFDFCDCIVGVAIYPDIMEFATDCWISEQTEGAEPPDDRWISFFKNELMKNLEKTGRIETPILFFINEDFEFKMFILIRRKRRSKN